MEFLPIFIVFVTCLVVKGNCETILCYKCDDCNKLNDSLLQSCPPDPVTTISTTPASTTEEDEEESTTEESTPMPDESTTDPESGDETEEMPESVSNPKVESVIRRTSRQINYKSLMRSKRAAVSYSYHCYSIKIPDGNKQKVKKDCVEVPENKTPCEVLKVQYGVSDRNCKTCAESKCNSSGVLKYTLGTLVIVMFVDLFYLYK